MPLFQCENCKCIENTSLGHFWEAEYCKEDFDWSEHPERKSMVLCSECAPTKYRNGKLTTLGQWHGEFPKMRYDPEKHGILLKRS